MYIQQMLISECLILLDTLLYIFLFLLGSKTVQNQDMDFIVKHALLAFIIRIINLKTWFAL